MGDVSQILMQGEPGDSNAAEQFLPLVYEDLRKLAAARLAREKPGHTLQATALVHEAYLRLVDRSSEQTWDNQGHFFAAAAETMRRIVVEHARSKGRLKRGGEFVRRDLDDLSAHIQIKLDELLAVDEAIDRLKAQNADAAQLVKLRYFAGMTIPETAQAMSISPRKADQIWAYARAWLMAEMADGPPA
jgi:RNA polymerase sigma factor (TIGR02999 family)